MKQVRVRMVRPGGIGDCFLLSFPKSGGMSHVLIDCGILKGTEEGSPHMRAAVADIIRETGGVLDVLVVTHEHWDHVSGFLQAEQLFKEELKIGEVWLAWTEKPDDDLAKQLRTQKAQAAKAIDGARQKLRLLVADDHPVLLALGALSKFSGDFGAAGGGGTAVAMTWAREGTGAPVRCLSTEDDPRTIPGVDGVRVFVLGPPRDPKLIGKSDPSRRAPEVYQLAGGTDLGFMAAFDDSDGMTAGHPFDPSFEKPVDKAKEDGFFRDRYYLAEDWRQIELDWLGAAERLALQLDSDTNNTSLVLAIELIDSGRVLLFPGDAQVGNWLFWTGEPPLTWSVKDRNGERVTITAYDLLARTVLYKVGHHASHNATLKEKGLELMESDELVAMIPVYEKQAHDQGKNGWDMPFPPLLQRLEEKTSHRVFRADLGVPAGWPKEMPGKYRETDDAIDYLIDM